MDVGWSDVERSEEYIRATEWMLHHYVTPCHATPSRTAPRRGHQIKSKRGLEHLEDNKALSTRGRDSIR